MTETQIGKIRDIKFGRGGYQDAMIGFTFHLGGKGWGIGDFWGTWAMERSPDAKWTDEERIAILGSFVVKIDFLMGQAKVSDFNDLKNIPVEVIIENNSLKSWRILEEAL